MDLTRVIGLGVAGNFAGHLEQAGEAESFKDVKTADARAPKAVFPFYLPAPGGRMADSFLKVFPLTSEEIRIPNDEPDADLYMILVSPHQNYITLLNMRKEDDVKNFFHSVYILRIKVSRGTRFTVKSIVSPYMTFLLTLLMSNFPLL